MVRPVADTTAAIANAEREVGVDREFVYYPEGKSVENPSGSPLNVHQIIYRQAGAIILVQTITYTALDLVRTIVNTAEANNPVLP